MICLICREPAIRHGLTSVKLERAEMYLAIKNVPARLCLHCGEAYVTHDVAVRLLQIAEDINKTGIPGAIIDYKTPGSE